MTGSSLFSDASWEKRSATAAERMNLWRVTRRILIGADDQEFADSSTGNILHDDNETQPRYFELEHVFWVKVSLSLLWTVDVLLTLVAVRLYGSRSPYPAPSRTRYQIRAYECRPGGAL